MSKTSSVRQRRPAAVIASIVAAAALVAAPATAALALDRPSRSSAEGPARRSARTAASTDASARLARLNTEAADADARLAAARERRSRIAADLTTARSAAEAARTRTDALSLVAAAAYERAQESKQRIQELAAAAYRDGAGTSTLASLLSSRDFGEFTYRHELVRRVGDRQRAIAAQARRDEAAARRAADDARAQRDRLIRRENELSAALPAADRAITDAQARAGEVRTWLARWQSIAGGAYGTPIMGAPQLDGGELAAWYQASRRRARVTVSMSELTSYYIEEGRAEGVRGDIAFAQSLLETGGFWFPDGGMVLPTDNNFAGIGACDSCATGHKFPDARQGVRAQMQWLRAYADPTVTTARLAHPPVDCCIDTFFLRGKVPTWGALTGTWATGAGYGDRILDLYREILAWLTDRAGF